jgi:hypothetical protein
MTSSESVGLGTVVRLTEPPRDCPPNHGALSLSNRPLTCKLVLLCDDQRSSRMDPGNRCDRILGRERREQDTCQADSPLRSRSVRRYTPCMNVVVEAAFIGVGGSVIVAVVAFVTSWASTDRMLKAERVRQIREKELATYELTLSELIGMQTARLNGQYSLSRPNTSFMADYIARRESESWIKTRGMLLAYAPQDVHDALEESIGCYVKAIQIYDRMQAARTSGQWQNEIPVLFDNLMNVVRDADVKDQALANAIRAQLGKEPVMLALPTQPRVSPDR